MTSLQRQIYALVAAIPPGRLMSYGSVAEALGRPRTHRAVGGALARLPDEHDIPWWRVINGSGRISTPSIHHTAQIQRSLLEGEGIELDLLGRIDWADYAWEPTPGQVAAAVARDPFAPEVGAP
jgi:methylated-DNA-protein-cysteine methyltransferase related protein